MDLTLLKEPFPEADIEWRPQRSGVKKNGDPYAMTLAYVTNRAVMDRLDDVVGAANWKNEFKASPNGGIICKLSIKVDDEWVTKEDGAENTKVEAVKGGLSGSMKRATFGNFHQYGKNSIKINNSWHKYDNPTLPSEFLPTKKGK